MVLRDSLVTQPANQETGMARGSLASMRRPRLAILQLHCQFYEGYGSTGIAYEKGGNVWMEGSSIHDKAGFQPEQSEFLQQARISTVVFIPWSDGVLELGTFEKLPENLILMDQIRDYFFTNILAIGSSQPAMCRLVVSSPKGLSALQPKSYASTIPMKGSSHQASVSRMRAFLEVREIPTARSLDAPCERGMRHHLSGSHSSEPISLSQQIYRR